MSPQRAIKAVLTDMARQGFELMLLLLCVGAGARGLWNAEALTSALDRSLPLWGRAVWYGGLLVGAVVAIIGIAMARPFGPLVERAGLIILTGSCLSYVALALAHGLPGLQQAVLVLLFAIVVLARIWLICREPYEISNAVKLLRSNMDGDR